MQRLSRELDVGGQPIARPVDPWRAIRPCSTRACLSRSALADTLLRVAERGLYRPLWSEQLLEEARDAIGEIHPMADAARIDRRFATMDAAFEDARIEAHPEVVIEIQLPDLDDRHVVATAVVGRADAIVTMNVKDFPIEVME